jgi:hypothetical protein
MRRCVAAVPLAVYLPACHHWVEPQGMTPEQYVDVEQPAELRLTLTDSSSVTLRGPWIDSDHLWGVDASGALRGIPFSSVQQMWVREPQGMERVVLAPLAGLAIMTIIGVGVGMAIGRSLEGGF